MALVLTRKLNESVLIGDDVEVTVCEIVAGHVKLAVKAPDSVAIVRKEIAQLVDGKVVRHGKH